MAAPKRLDRVVQEITNLERKAEQTLDENAISNDDFLVQTFSRLKKRILHDPDFGTVASSGAGRKQAKTLEDPLNSSVEQRRGHEFGEGNEDQQAPLATGGSTTDFATLPYKQLQQLCKEFGIQGNLKKEMLVNKLNEHFRKKPATAETQQQQESKKQSAIPSIPSSSNIADDGSSIAASGSIVEDDDEARRLKLKEMAEKVRKEQEMIQKQLEEIEAKKRAEEEERLAREQALEAARALAVKEQMEREAKARADELERLEREKAEAVAKALEAQKMEIAQREAANQLAHELQQGTLVATAAAATTTTASELRKKIASRLGGGSANVQGPTTPSVSTESSTPSTSSSSSSSAAPTIVQAASNSQNMPASAAPGIAIPGGVFRVLGGAGGGNANNSGSTKSPLYRMLNQNKVVAAVAATQSPSGGLSTVPVVQFAPPVSRQIQPPVIVAPEASSTFAPQHPAAGNENSQQGNTQPLRAHSPPSKPGLVRPSDEGQERASEYKMSDPESDSDAESDEDSDKDNSIPKWAKGDELLKALKDQYENKRVDPDAIFPQTALGEFPLEEIFKRRGVGRPRSSSAIWKDSVSVDEIVKYREDTMRPPY